MQILEGVLIGIAIDIAFNVAWHEFVVVRHIERKLTDVVFHHQLHDHAVKEEHRGRP